MVGLRDLLFDKIWPTAEPQGTQHGSVKYWNMKLPDNRIERVGIVMPVVMSKPIEEPTRSVIFGGKAVVSA